MLVTLFVAVVIPFSAGATKFGGTGVMGIGLIVAAMWVLTSVPESFAGERDHRTLETLLATRLPAEAILAGKLLASVVVATALGTVAILLSVIASNVGTVVHGALGDALSVPWLSMGLGVVLAVLVAFALSNVGILVALRARPRPWWPCECWASGSPASPSASASASRPCPEERPATWPTSPPTSGRSARGCLPSVGRSSSWC